MATTFYATSLTEVLEQGQKDNTLSYVRPELLNTRPNKKHQRVQRELAVILT